MEKKTKKLFTLVEMLIVVVIIGILAAALLPKLTGAQERARDAARKANLNQLVSALGSHNSDKGSYPTGYCISDIGDSIMPEYIKSIPIDPQSKRVTYGTKNGGCTDGSYAYTSMKRNSAENAGMVIVADTESEGKDNNFVLRYSSSIDYKTNPTFLTGGGNKDTTTDPSLSGDYSFGEVVKAEEYLCAKGVDIDSSATQSVIHKGGSAVCTAKDNPAAVYIVTQ